MSAEPIRVAIVGADDLQARALSQALREGGFSAKQLLPLSARLGEIEISLAGDDSAEVFLPLEREHVAAARVVALFSRDPAAREAVNSWVVGEEKVLLDLAPCPGFVSGWLDPFRPADGTAGGTALTVAGPAALYLARILSHLETRELGALSVQVFLPASHYGEAGVLELFHQTTALMNFRPIPQEVLGRQVAFNLLPAPDDPGFLDFSAQVCSLSGRGDLPVTCVALQSPSFHGTTLSGTLAVPEAPEVAKKLRAALEGDPVFGRWEGEGWPSPVGVAGMDRPFVSILPLDGRTLWLWLVFDNGKAGTGALAARWILGDRSA